MKKLHDEARGDSNISPEENKAIITEWLRFDPNRKECPHLINETMAWKRGHGLKMLTRRNNNMVAILNNHAGAIQHLKNLIDDQHDVIGQMDFAIGLLAAKLVQLLPPEEAKELATMIGMEALDQEPH